MSAAFVYWPAAPRLVEVEKYHIAQCLSSAQTKLARIVRRVCTTRKRLSPRVHRTSEFSDSLASNLTCTERVFAESPGFRNKAICVDLINRESNLLQWEHRFHQSQLRTGLVGPM
jgi:hypothetical protein